MEGTIQQLQHLALSIEKLLTNIKKDGPSRKTPQYCSSRIATLYEEWDKFRKLHAQLQDGLPEDHSYFQSNIYGKTKEIYDEAHALLQREIAAQAKKTSLQFPDATTESTISPKTNPVHLGLTAAETTSPDQQFTTANVFRKPGTSSEPYQPETTGYEHQGAADYTTVGHHYTTPSLQDQLPRVSSLAAPNINFSGYNDPLSNIGNFNLP